MAKLIEMGLLQADDPIFREPVTRWPARLGRRSSGSKMIPPNGSDEHPTDQADAGYAPTKPKDE
jgi:hypothetical protein